MMPPCCVCGDWQVPRRIVMQGEAVVIASVCVDAKWCQGRAAANKLDGLVSA